MARIKFSAKTFPFHYLGRTAQLGHVPVPELWRAPRLIQADSPDPKYRNFAGLQLPDPALNPALGRHMSVIVGGGCYGWYAPINSRIAVSATGAHVLGDYGSIPLPEWAHYVEIINPQALIHSDRGWNPDYFGMATSEWLGSRPPEPWALRTELTDAQRIAMYAAVDTGITALQVAGWLNSPDVNVTKAMAIRTAVKDAMMATLTPPAPVGTQWVVIPGFYSGIHAGTVKIFGDPVVALVSPVQPYFPLALLSRDDHREKGTIYCGFFSPDEGFCQHPYGCRADRWHSRETPHQPTGSIGIIPSLTQWGRVARGETLAEHEFDW